MNSRKGLEKREAKSNGIALWDWTILLIVWQMTQLLFFADGLRLCLNLGLFCSNWKLQCNL